MKKIKILILLSLVVLAGSALAQDEIVDYPKVGEQIKDHTFTDLEDYPAKSLKISDFRGKWLIMDFWAFSCGGCIASFPKMNNIASKYKDRVAVLMIGAASAQKWNVKNKGLMFERRKAEKLNFSVAYDLQVVKKYDIRYLPYILLIDPYGKIVAKTMSINEEQIDVLLSGDIPPFSRAFSAHEKIDYDEKLPMLTSGSLSNGGVDTSYVFRSLLAPYSYKMPYIPAIPFYYKNAKLSEKGLYEASRITLEQLYRLAYFGNLNVIYGDKNYGEVNPKVLLNLKDTSAFIYDKGLKSLAGYYAYSNKLPKNRISTEILMRSLQDDLYRTFGYVAALERRLTMIYALEVIDLEKVEKLRTAGGPTEYTQIGKGRSGFKFVNKPMKEFFRMFAFCIPHSNVFLDLSKISYNVDCTISGDMHSLEKMNSELAKYGLSIVQTWKEMTVLVLTDQ